MQTKTKSKRWTRLRHNFIIYLAGLVLFPWMRLKYHVKVTPCPALRKRQCVVLLNHQTAFDQFFVSRALFPRHVYFVASEDLFSMGLLSRLLRWAVAPIPIKKQTTDVQSVKTCMRVAREGGTIALAPEGNRTYSGLPCYSNPAIAPFIKRLGLPVAIFRIEGGYGIQPRWSDVCRKGRMHAFVHRIIELEEYEKLSNDDLYALIQTELFVDETQNKQLFHHKKLSEYLERAMYVCPVCGLTEFRSENDIITCTRCKRQVRYLPNQQLKGVDWEFPFPYVAQWYAYQENHVNQLDTTAHIEAPLYRDTVTISEVEPYRRKTVLEEQANLLLYGNRLQMGDRTLFFTDISVITVLGKNKLNIYHTDALYQIKGNCRFNALKYMNIFYRNKNQRTGGGNFLGI